MYVVPRTWTLGLNENRTARSTTHLIFTVTNMTRTRAFVPMVTSELELRSPWDELELYSVIWRTVAFDLKQSFTSRRNIMLTQRVIQMCISASCFRWRRTKISSTLLQNCPVCSSNGFTWAMCQGMTKLNEVLEEGILMSTSCLPSNCVKR